jgi:hypothetical protein
VQVFGSRFGGVWRVVAIVNGRRLTVCGRTLAEVIEVLT